MLSAHPFALDNTFSSFSKTTYASQIKFSRLAQVEDILAREGGILVYPGFTCQTCKSPITQGVPRTRWPVGPWNPRMLSLFLLVYLSDYDFPLNFSTTDIYDCNLEICGLRNFVEITTEQQQISLKKGENLDFGNLASTQCLNYFFQNLEENGEISPQFFL